MPFTPFHLGPALLIGVLTWKYLDFPTLILGSLIVDIRTALVFFNIIDGSLHGILHTFAGGTLLAFMLVGAITPFREYFALLMNELSFPQQPDDSTIVGAAFISIYLHILLDAILYSDMQPFMPLNQNPLLGAVSTDFMYAFCGFTAVIALGLIPLLVHRLQR
jgi:membrane-bound metal-dependent hydrolase YbcI (DUF457 family)